MFQICLKKLSILLYISIRSSRQMTVKTSGSDDLFRAIVILACPETSTIIETLFISVVYAAAL